VPVKEGIHTAMETVDLPQRTISWNSKAADLLLYDIKLINNEMHKKKQVLEMT
jgi:pyruvate-formate lyase-activating enzyme